MRFKLSILEHNGTFSFVGSVPYELSYIDSNGQPVSPELGESQLRLPSKYRTIKTRVFKSIEDARQAALKMGISI